MFTRLRKAVLPVLVFAGGIGTFVVLQATKPQPESATEPPRPTSVYAKTAVRESARLTVETQGEVRARVATDIVVQVGGRVVEVSPEFIEGGHVRPGEPLLAIEATDYASAVDEAEARLAAAEVDLEQALADADVARKQLAGQPNPSPLALRKPQVAGARAALEAAQANLSLTRTNLERTRITVPFEGRIAAKSVDLGQFVVPGTVVGRAFATDKVEIRLPLTDSQLAALGVPIGYTAPPGAGPRVDLSAVVGGEAHHWVGQVTRLDAAIDPMTRAVFATAEVVDPYAGPMPLAVGLHVDAEISGKLVDQAIRIPADGLRAGGKVFVVDSEGLLDIRTADVIYRNRDTAVLAAGVEAGERVVVSAIRNPIPGMRLSIIGDSPEETAPAESLATY